MSWLLIFMGGGLGALARYALAVALPRAEMGFPWATFMANVVGALLIGAIAGALMERTGARAFWIVGLLGGFTTFSAFSLEALQLIEQRQIVLALTYILGSVALGLLACVAGLRVSSYA